MQYVELRQRLEDFTIFSLGDIRRADPDFHRRRLNEWQDKGYIKKIIKGYYVFSGLGLNEKVLFEIANRIYSPSYVSFEMALSYYGLIPESVYGITSACTRRTYRFKTNIAEFIYRSIKPELFFGYSLVEYNSKYFKMASPEKAILDFFYINKSIKNADDFASLRINKDIFLKLIDEKRLYALLGKFKQKSLTRRVRLFCRFIKYA